MRYEGKTGTRRILFSLLWVVGIFALELLIPWWLVSGVAYVTLVLIGLWWPQRRVTLVAAVAGTTVTIASHFFSQTVALPAWMVLAHCSVWVAAIWATAIAILQRKQADEALRESQRFTDRVVQAAPDLVYIYDLIEQRHVYTSRRVAEFFGYTPDQIHKMDPASFKEALHPEDVSKLAELKQRFAAAQDHEVIEMEYRLKDAGGAWHWVRSRDVVFSRTEAGAPKEILCVAVDITEHRRAEDALRASEAALRHSQDTLRALTARLISAQEEERRRLARELHDELNQRLTVLAIEAAKLEPQLSSSPDLVRERLEWLQEQLGNLSEEVRLLSHQLHPAVLDYLGLGTALEAECDGFSKREGIPVNFRRESVPESLPEEVSLCLYRVAQEGLKNVAKHAHATEVTVTLAGTEEGVLLSVCDSGVGFDPESVTGKGGLGLVSMEERVRLVNGSLSVTFRPAEGTEVVARIPLPRGGE
jgi:PAS domain S-box-containing protein